MNNSHFDVILAGGGLAATLTAYRLRQLRPDLRLCVLEAGEKLEGTIPGFYDKDISRDAWRWIALFVHTPGTNSRCASQALAYAHVRV